jgi:tetratricopeptide (TPR) repeat protein
MDRLAALREFLREDPADAFTRFALAQELWKSGDHEQARRIFEELVAEQPEYVGTYYHLGKLYEELGRTGEAIRTYEEGIGRATAAGDPHARSELQSALLEARGIGFDDE